MSALTIAPTRRRRLGTAAMAALTFLALTPLAEARTGTVPGGFADLAEKVTPAVVNISTERAARVSDERRGPEALPDLPEASPHNDMFRRFRERQGRNPGDSPFPRRSENARALGSGFIIDPAGYIVTNNHVIDGASKITVTLTDGRKFTAKLVGRDAKTDLALLKIDGDGKLPSVELATGGEGRVGDWVMAVGNPFGLGGTVTVGIISARNRDLRSGPYDDYLQVDAAINRGNSGGPLFNMDGKVVGINTAIYSPTGGSIGIGFAISAAVAAPVIAQLREHGRVERGWIGVRVQSVTEDIAKALGLAKAEGALVAQVEPNSPAARAGVKSGDVITAVEGRRVANFRDLARLVAGLRNGAAARIGLVRDGKELTVEARIGDQPKEANARPSGEKNADSKASYGLALAPLTDEARETYGLSTRLQGVLIANVVAGSPAAEKGLQAGDVILSVGQESVGDPAAAIRKLNQAKDARKPVVLLISRKGETLFVAVQAA